MEAHGWWACGAWWLQLRPLVAAGVLLLLLLLELLGLLELAALPLQAPPLVPPPPWLRCAGCK